ncbi:MAG: hypothetical protein ACI92G_001272 [Candidatus Pelagisphaera sp.]
MAEHRFCATAERIRVNLTENRLKTTRVSRVATTQGGVESPYIRIVVEATYNRVFDRFGFRTSFHRCAASLDRAPRLAAGSSLPSSRCYAETGREGRFVRLIIGAEDR